MDSRHSVTIGEEECGGDVWRPLEAMCLVDRIMKDEKTGRVECFDDITPDGEILPKTFKSLDVMKKTHSAEKVKYWLRKIRNCSLDSGKAQVLGCAAPWPEYLKLLTICLSTDASYLQDKVRFPAGEFDKDWMDGKVKKGRWGVLTSEVGESLENYGKHKWKEAPIKILARIARLKGPEEGALYECYTLFFSGSTRKSPPGFRPCIAVRYDELEDPGAPLEVMYNIGRLPDLGRKHQQQILDLWKNNFTLGGIDTLDDLRNDRDWGDTIVWVETGGGLSAQSGSATAATISQI